MEHTSTEKRDFGVGSVSAAILRLAIPMTFAQLINVLYSVVDRIYIGHLPHTSTEALTGIGLTLPVITIVTAFANLFGMGGAPLFSMERGRENTDKARTIMGNSFALILIFGLLLSLLCYLFKEPLLYLFGASDTTYPYADAYLSIYLLGTIFVMISLGMNNFINAQGFGVMGMLTVSIGAVLNLILDPVFIFIFGLGIRGAAVATVISQMISALWVLKFLTGKKALITLSRRSMRIKRRLVRDITTLGLSGFIMSITNGAVQIICNATLQNYGGDLYIGIMTVINSVREIVNIPVNGFTNSAQPVMSFNYGAQKYGRVKSAIRFMTIFCIVFTLIVWALIFFFPHFFIQVFNSDPALLDNGIPALHVYFFGIFMMALQFSGQSTFVALGYSRHTIFFSLLRKAVIVIPLTIWLPTVGNLGTTGVFLAEPISNFIGGTACFVTLMFTVWRQLDA